MNAFRGWLGCRLGIVALALVLVAHAVVPATRAASPTAFPSENPLMAGFWATMFSSRGQDRDQLPADALEGGRDWINTRSPIHLEDLRGKIVLLDFWTYCCINCHHILPDLAKLEAKYANQLVVIGVHTAKFDAERETANIRKKVNEYGIKHPVINDADQTIWSRFGVQSWPTLVLIDPQGRVVWVGAGEGHGAELDTLFAGLIVQHRALGDLDETPLKFAPEDEKKHDSPLRYPGKVLADAAGKRLFISDTANNRIVVTDLDGKLQFVAGTGQPGRKDGAIAEARFHRPQGMCLVADTLYVADTENHLIRAIDVEKKTVATVAGTGAQAPFRFRGGPLKSAPISSPWDIIAAPGRPGVFFVAMAGTHQIWKLDLEARKINAWAGTGMENIIDGSRATAAFAQPSGLATDGHVLFVADSEVSGVRTVGIESDDVRTIVGVGLFGFGDEDGEGRAVRLQHCLGLTYGGDKLYIADTYNNKIKVCNPKNHSVQTLVGQASGGLSDHPAAFDEPGGLSIAGNSLYVADTNNHAIRAIDLKTKAVRTLKLDGVSPPKPARRPPTFPNATVIEAPVAQVRPGDRFTLSVNLTIPESYKVNPDAPMPYLIEVPDRKGVLAPAVSPTGDRIQPPSNTFEVVIPLAKPAKAGTKLSLRFSVAAFLCQSSLCEIHSFIWEIPVEFKDGGKETISLSNQTEKK